jgi:hypothetical protein
LLCYLLHWSAQCPASRGTGSSNSPHSHLASRTRGWSGSGVCAQMLCHMRCATTTRGSCLVWQYPRHSVHQGDIRTCTMRPQRVQPRPATNSDAHCRVLGECEALTTKTVRTAMFQHDIVTANDMHGLCHSRSDMNTILCTVKYHATYPNA